MILPPAKPAGFKPNARVPKLKVGGALVNKYTNLHQGNWGFVVLFLCLAVLFVDKFC